MELNNLPKVTRQDQSSQAPAVTTAVSCLLLSHVFLYWFKSSYEGALTGHNDSATWAAARSFAEIFFVLSDCLGTVLFLGGQLWWPKALLKLRYFFKVLSWWTLFPSGYELCLLFGNKKDTHPIRIIVIPCIGKRSKVLETGKQEVSAPLTVDLLCFTCVCCLFALRWESVRVSLRNFFMCSNSFLILKNEGT